MRESEDKGGGRKKKGGGIMSVEKGFSGSLSLLLTLLPGGNIHQGNEVRKWYHTWSMRSKEDPLGE